MTRFELSSTIVTLLFSVSLGNFANAESDAKPNTGYEKGFYIQTPDNEYKLKISGRMKTLAAYKNQSATSTASLAFQETRLDFSGHLLGGKLAYTVQHDLADNKLKDFYFKIELAKDCTYFTVGQFTAPFGRQALNSTGKINFIDRSLATKGFYLSRTLGMILSNDQGQPIEWSAGLFQEGFLGRIGYADKNMKQYDETDFEGGDLRTYVGASAYVKTSFNNFEVLGFAGAVDAMLKAAGSTTQAAIFVGRPNLKTDLDTDPTLTAGKQQIGAHAQFAYLINQWIEPAARYSLLTTPSAAKLTHELTGVVNLFMLNKFVKAQFEGGVILEDSKLKSGLANFLLQVAI